MGFVAIRLRKGAVVTPDMRKLFVRLTLLSERMGSSMWEICGDDQATLAGSGSFHKEGRYLLRSVAKRWTTGSMFSKSRHFKDTSDGDLYFAILPFGVVLSTSKAALRAALPGVGISTVSDRHKAKRQTTAVQGPEEV
jgi:hypothetical protein